MVEKEHSKIIVTSALPYANGPIHIGHLVEYIQTDIIVRYLKLIGRDAVYLCADDTHGTPIEINAKKAGKEPEEFIKEWHEAHKKSFSLYNIEFDNYHTTNSEENKHFVELIYKRLQEKGMIYQKEIEQAYDKKLKRFLPDRYVQGTCPKCGAEEQYGDQCEKCGATYKPTDMKDAKSTLSGDKPITKKSTHYFFKLSEMSSQLKEWIEGNSLIQDEVRNQIMNWIDNGLEDWCISRDGPYFGFKIPDSEKYFYVWLDAPVGYIASFANLLGDVDAAESQWNNSEIVHYIGKDIIYFHLLFWPAVLMAADLNIPKKVFVHGFLTVKKEKMSKSKGTFITADDWAKMTEPEFLRFYYAHNLTDKVEDINLDLEDFKEKINNELVSNIANLIYRTLYFINNYFDSTLGEEIDNNFTEVIKRREQDVLKHYQEHNLRKAVNMILYLSSEGNKYFQDNQPWATVRTRKKECIRVLTTCANLVKNIAILLKPIMPAYAAKIEEQLGLSNLNSSDIGYDLKGHKIGKAEIIYQKIEELNLERDKSLFNMLDLRVALIKEVKEHPNADKLYIMKLDVGDEERQIVAGLREHYEIEDLLDKKIILAYNMEPAEIRGEKSEGMLLAAEGPDYQGENAVGILFVQETPAGERVGIKGYEPSGEMISFDQFKNIEIRAEKGRVYHNRQKLKTNIEYVKVEKVLEGLVR